MLAKHPFVIGETFVFSEFKESEWSERFATAPFDAYHFLFNRFAFKASFQSLTTSSVIDFIVFFFYYFRKLYPASSLSTHKYASLYFNPYLCNGLAEGCNNKIKVLKRNAYGYRNFERFRKRILHMFNYKKANTGTAVA